MLIVPINALCASLATINHMSKISFLKYLYVIGTILFRWYWENFKIINLIEKFSITDSQSIFSPNDWIYFMSLICNLLMKKNSKYYCKKRSQFSLTLLNDNFVSWKWFFIFYVKDNTTDINFVLIVLNNTTSPFSYAHCLYSTFKN